jgi:hypothetical protein
MEWVRISDEEVANEVATAVWAPYVIGARVRVSDRSAVDPGRTGTVACWGRGAEADRQFREAFPVLRDGAYELLIDGEGPCVRFDDQAPGDESLDWFPGQGMGVLEPLP